MDKKRKRNLLMKKIIIVGAGPAGLTAGYELVQRTKDYEVIIMEESTAVGGISKTVIYHGNRMDMGGHRFFSKNDRVNDWWKTMIPYADNKKQTSQDYVMLHRKRVSHIYYHNTFFEYPINMNFNTIRNLGLVKTLCAGFSYLYACVFKKPEISLENFYINRFGKKLYEMFFKDYTEKLWGIPASKLSPDWGVQRVKGLSICVMIKQIYQKFLGRHKQEVETSLIDAFQYPKYGCGQLWEHVGQQFVKLGGQIKYGCMVCGLYDRNGEITQVEYMKNGIKYCENADIVISSMPLRNLVVSLNNVPKKIMKIASGLQYRDFVIVGVLLDKKEFNQQGGTKDCWIYVQDSSASVGRIQIFNNWSPYMVENPKDTIWLGLEYFCSEGEAIWNRTKKEWKEVVKAELQKIGLLSKKAHILDCHYEKVKKAYPSYVGTYHQLKILKEYLNHFDNLYCIGRNGQHRYNNMDHSMLTAFEAADDIILHKKEKDNIWNINTEKEYHEKK